MLKAILIIFGGAVFTVVLALGAMMLPKSSCSVEWLDSNFERFDGPFSTCPEKLNKRSVGRSEFVQIGPDVYALQHYSLVEPAGFPCMIGVTCFPLPQGKKTWETYIFFRLDGPIKFMYLKAYLNGDYISDGMAIFSGYKRVPATNPPVDPTRLRWLPCMRTDDASRCESYATDGVHVLNSEKIVQGADPSSFKDDLPALTQDGKLESSYFARDRASVYAHGKRIDRADPTTFGVLKKDRIVGFDRQHAWRDSVDDVKQEQVSPEELRQLHADFEAAWATRRARD